MNWQPKKRFIRPKLRKAFYLFLVLIVLFSFLFLVWEGMARIFGWYKGYVPHIRGSEILRFEGKPFAKALHPVNINDTDWKLVEINYNSYGFRDNEFNLHKNENEIRIAVLGDSFVEAMEVNATDRFTNILQKMLNNKKDGHSYTVMNFGILGYGTDQYYLTLKNKVLQFNPDIVILSIFFNDLRDMEDNQLSELQDGKVIFKTIKWNILQKKLKPILAKSRLFEYLFYNFKLLKLNYHAFLGKLFHLIAKEENSKIFVMDYELFTKDYSKILGYYQELQFKILKLFQNIIKENNIRLILMLPSATYQLYSEDREVVLEYLKLKESMWDNEKPNKAIGSFAKENNIEFIDFYDHFNEEINKGLKERVHFKVDTHWNELGHQLAAEKLFVYLED